MVCHPSPTPFSLPPLPPFPSLFPPPPHPCLLNLFPFLISINLKDLGFFFPILTWNGNFCFQCKQCWICNSKSFLTKLCITVWFCFLFYFDFFPFMWSLGKHEFRIISHFYLNVVLRVNFLYWSLYWWVHATGNKFFVQKLQSESLCITETLFITSLLFPTQKTVGLNKIICILIYLKCL